MHIISIYLPPKLGTIRDYEILNEGKHVKNLLLSSYGVWVELEPTFCRSMEPWYIHHTMYTVQYTNHTKLKIEIA